MTQNDVHPVFYSTPVSFDWLIPLTLTLNIFDTITEKRLLLF